MTKKYQFTIDFEADIEAYLKTLDKEIIDYRILSQSLDARSANRGRRPTYHYVIEAIKSGERFSAFQENFPKLGPDLSLKAKGARPIIVGAGPAGLFCALRLSEYGIESLLLERGGPADQRMLKISRYWRKGELDLDDNVCFGEGGAGLFSDGKLITRIKSPYVSYVMKRLVDFGAPPETAYVSNPHLGSNKIRPLIRKLSQELQNKGVKQRFHTRVKQLIIEHGEVKGVELHTGEKIFSPWVILATGHSAKEIYYNLKAQNVAMKAKNFAVGVRIEHSRKLIDHLQYGEFHQKLSAARYRLSWENPQTGKGSYSFCMCPGGYVLSSGTDPDGLVSNGMSNYAHNSPWSNAALVVSVKAQEDFDATKDVLAGLHYQEAIEKRAYLWSKEKASGKELPAQRLGDFLGGKTPSLTLPKNSCPSGVVPAALQELLPSSISTHLFKALDEFNRQLKGFKASEALLLAPETRTSAPVTVERDSSTLESVNISGLFPCGEGAGYAGGITSAAVDGVKVAMALLKKEGHQCFEGL